MGKLPRQLVLAAAVLGGVIQAGMAQPFAYTNNDLCLGFRKTGTNQENYEAVVNIGKAATYLNLALGTTITVPNFTASQLTPDSFSSLNTLNWSVFGYSQTNRYNLLPGYVNNTLWLTVPRANSSVQADAPYRLDYGSQNNAATAINSIGGNARYLSSLTASNQDNTATFVREPIGNPSDLSAYMGAVGDSTASTLNDTWIQNNLENMTPVSFSAPVVSDLYEVRPTADALGHPVTDPHTLQASGPAYYVGYFTFSPSGTMTFTRAAASAPPPPAPVLSVSRSGTTSTIAFGTTNGAIYTLYFTNAAGLSAPGSTWPSSPTTVTGDGTTKTLSDTTADPNRFYRVGAH
jgi:hypothetical protein